MHQAIVVDVLVGFGGLGLAIQNETPTKGVGVHNVNGLVSGAARMKDVLDTVNDHHVGGD